MGNALAGDFGRSIVNRKPVIEHRRAGDARDQG